MTMIRDYSVAVEVTDRTSLRIRLRSESTTPKWHCRCADADTSVLSLTLTGLDVCQTFTNAVLLMSCRSRSSPRPKNTDNSHKRTPVVFYLDEEVNEIWICLEFATQCTQEQDFISLSRTCTHFTTDTHQPLTDDTASMPYYVHFHAWKWNEINQWNATHIGVLQAAMFVSNSCNSTSFDWRKTQGCTSIIWLCLIAN